MVLNPKISVLMAVYNAEVYLREAIDSVLSQSWKEFEFLIFDDCSTDSSLEILKLVPMTREFNCLSTNVIWASPEI